MYRSFLAWRYLRRRRTNLIGIVGIFVAVAALIMILSIMSGFLEESRKTMRGSLSDLLVEPWVPGFARGDAPTDPQPVIDAILQDDRVVAASAHLVWYCTIAGEADAEVILSSSQFGQYAGAKLIGIDVEDEFEATELRAALTREPTYGGRDSRVADPDDPFAPPPGYDPTVGRPRASVILGEQLYRAHSLYRGAFVTLATLIPDPAGGDPDFSSREFVVAGTFRSGENEMDLERIYVQREALARYLAGIGDQVALGKTDKQYSEILVKLKDYERDGQAVRDELALTLVTSGLLPPHSLVKTWEEFRELLLGAIENERVLMAIMLSLVLLVAGFTIFAILSMMVTEKRRDIGILTALGATRHGITTLFVLIGFFDALIGASLGAVAGTWAALEIDDIERWLSRTFGLEIFNRDVYLFDHIPSVVDPLSVAEIELGSFACTLLFAAVPAVKAGGMDPLDALRYE
jgi:lipoprotein-releasing system permease protein